MSETLSDYSSVNFPTVIEGRSEGAFYADELKGLEHDSNNWEALRYIKVINKHQTDGTAAVYHTDYYDIADTSAREKINNLAMVINKQASSMDSLALKLKGITTTRLYTGARPKTLTINGEDEEKTWQYGTLLTYAHGDVYGYKDENGNISWYIWIQVDIDGIPIMDSDKSYVYTYMKRLNEGDEGYDKYGTKYYPNSNEKSCFHLLKTDKYNTIISTGTGETNYTPAGTVTVTPTTENVNQIDSVGSMPKFDATVTDETLTLGWTDGAVPTMSAKSVSTGIASATFTGTGVDLEANVAPVNPTA